MAFVKLRNCLSNALLSHQVKYHQHARLHEAVAHVRLRLHLSGESHNEVQIKKEISLFEHMYKTSKYSKDGLISDTTFEFWTNTEALKEIF